MKTPEINPEQFSEAKQTRMQPQVIESLIFVSKSDYADTVQRNVYATRLKKKGLFRIAVNKHLL